MINNYTLSDACFITTGKLDSNAVVEGGIYPFYTCAAEPTTIDYYDYDDSVVLIAGNNAQGNFHVNRFTGKFNAYQRTYILTKKEGHDLDYIYYALKLELKRLKEKSQGSQTKFLTMPILNSINLGNRNLLEQQKIANVLSSLDSKIELNNKINKELETMAKTLYDYWFVQFDFSDENGKPYKSSGGKMVYNKELKRDIPEGWVVKKLGDYAEIKRGDLITARETLEGKIKVVAAGINYSYLHSKSNREENTITISGSGANAGHINFWREPIFASDCTTVRGKNDIDTIMILNHLYLLQDYIYSQSKGSAQPHVYPEDIKQLFIPVAPDYLVNKFCAIVLPSNKRIAINEQQNQELAKLRDWLLPMLMNGQVKVK